MLIGGRAHSLIEAAYVGKAHLDFAEINLPNFHDATQDIPALLQLKKKFNFFLLVHGPEEGNPFDCNKLRASLLPQVKVLLDFASSLDARLITLHFWLDQRFIDKPVLKEKLKLLEAMMGLAQKKQIKLCLENLSERPSDFEDAFRTFPELGLTLDIGHGELLSPRNTSYYFIENFPERISHVHIHDNRGGNTPGDDLHLPLGEGSISLGPILSALCKTGYDKTITLEVPSDILVQEKAKIEALLRTVTSKQ
jgi:sugar phosphate isomerase/epimerase